MKGWSAQANGNITKGFWSNTEKNPHTSQLELLAAFYELGLLAKNQQACQLLLGIDNKTAITFINNKEKQHTNLNNIVQQIYLGCKVRHIEISLHMYLSTEKYYSRQ